MIGTLASSEKTIEGKRYIQRSLWKCGTSALPCLTASAQKTTNAPYQTHQHIYVRLLKSAVLNKHALISIQMDFLADFQMRSVDGQQVGRPN